MNKLVLHCSIKNPDILSVYSRCDDNIELSIESMHGERLKVYLSKDSAQQLSDYVTTWLGEAE